jgi:putative ABC transport system permease protein
MHGLATGAFNWTTFAEVAFEFRLTTSLLISGVIFGLLMGILGGLLPAWMAARKPVLESLRAG